MQLNVFHLRTLAVAGGLGLLPALAWAQRPATTTPSSSMARPQSGTPNVLPAAPGAPNARPAQVPSQTSVTPGSQPTNQPAQPGQAAPGTTAPSATAVPAGGSGPGYGQYPVVVGMPAGVPLRAAMGPTDTLRLTLKEAQQQFVQTNFQLLAQRFNVNLAQATVTQSALRDNPNLALEGNLYNPTTHQFFPFGRNQTTDAQGNTTGNTVSLQLQQLINLTGSRIKLVELSSTNVAVQQAAFEDLLRISRYQLSQTFYNVEAERRKLDLLRAQRDQLARLLVGFREQLRLGTVAGFEVTRLELEQQSLEKDRGDQLNQLTTDEAALRVFLALPGTTFVAPQGQELLPAPPTTLPALTDLIALAYQYRPDLRAATRQIDYANQNLRLQRSLAVPKLAVGLAYASFGNAYPNYYGLQTAIDLPVANRNQGNVQAARVGIQQNAQTLNQTKLQVEQDVAAAVEQIQRAADLRSSVSDAYVATIANVSRNAIADYKRRLIDLVSFIDKFRAYNAAQLNLIDIGNRLEQAKQQVNFVTNTPVFTD